MDQKLLAEIKEWIKGQEYVKVTDMTKIFKIEDFMMSLDIIDVLVEEGILDPINVKNKGFKVLR
jgi:hypothetical protein